MKALRCVFRQERELGHLHQQNAFHHDAPWLLPLSCRCALAFCLSPPPLCRLSSARELLLAKSPPGARPHEQRASWPLSARSTPRGQGAACSRRGPLDPARSQRGKSSKSGRRRAAPRCLSPRRAAAPTSATLACPFATSVALFVSESTLRLTRRELWRREELLRPRQVKLGRREGAAAWRFRGYPDDADILLFVLQRQAFACVARRASRQGRQRAAPPSRSPRRRRRLKPLLNYFALSLKCLEWNYNCSRGLALPPGRPALSPPRGGGGGGRGGSSPRQAP